MHKFNLAKLDAIPDEGRWGFTYAETRAKLGVGQWSINRLIKQGHLEVYHIGKSARVTAESLNKLEKRLVK